LLKTCCATSPDLQRNQALTRIALPPARILRAGERVDIFALDYTATNLDLFENFNRKCESIRTRLLLLGLRRVLDNQGCLELFQQDQSKYSP
jgi:hypothetical protein